MKRFLGSVMLLAGLIVIAASASAEPSIKSDSTQMKKAASQKVVVYYLYFNPRCETCLNMEAFAREAVETGFAKELKSGTVEWHSYDTDLDPYKHFWNDFKMDTKCLIIEKFQDGKSIHWKNCEKIWDLAGAKPDFLKYVQDEVKAELNSQ